MPIATSSAATLPLHFKPMQLSQINPKSTVLANDDFIIRLFFFMLFIKIIVTRFNSNETQKVSSFLKLFILNNLKHESPLHPCVNKYLNPFDSQEKSPLLKFKIKSIFKKVNHKDKQKRLLSCFRKICMLPNETNKLHRMQYLQIIDNGSSLEE